MKIWLGLIGGMIATMLAIGFGRFGYTPMIPVMIEQAQLGIKAAGLIASVNYVGYMVGALTPLVWHGEGVRQTTVRSGLLLTVLGFALMSVQISDQYQVYLWAFARFLNGVGSAWILINVSSIILQRLAEFNKLAYMGWLYAAIGLGSLMVTACVQYFEFLNLSWVQDWQTLTVIGVLLSVPVILFVKESLPQTEISQSQIKTTPMAATFSDVNVPIVWLLALAYACKGFSYIIVMTFLPVMVKGLTGLGEHAWYILLWVTVPSTMLWGWLSERFGNIRCLQAAFILQAIGIVAPVLIAGDLGVLICAVLVGATFLGVVTMTLAQAQFIKPHASTKIMALVTGVYSVGQFVGPGFAGWMAETTGSFNVALVIASGLLCIGVFLLFAVQTRFTRDYK